MNPVGFPDEMHSLFGTTWWDKMTAAEKGEAKRHMEAWRFSQFMHGEQGALICTAKIVETVPDIDSKFYAATQVIDEARRDAEFRYAMRLAGESHRVQDPQRGDRSLTVSDALASAAAATIRSRAGRTSSHRRVFRPQSGFTQICSGCSAAAARSSSDVISLTVGINGAWMS